MMYVAVVVIYMAPFLIALARGLDSPFAFLFGNLFGGTTIFGWFFVLYLALSCEAPGTPSASERPTPPRAFIYAPTFIAQAVVLEAVPCRAAPAPTLRALPSDRWSRRA